MGTIETSCDHKWCGQVAYALTFCSVAFQKSESKHTVVIFKEARYQDHIYFCHDLALSVIGSKIFLKASKDMFSGAKKRIVYPKHRSLS